MIELLAIILLSATKPKAVPPKPVVPKTVFLLTIDDSPTRFSRSIASNLLKLKAPATFFVTGEIKSESSRATLWWLVEKGFELGNHTRSHSYELCRSGSEERIKADLDYITTNLRTITGVAPRYARAPAGCWSMNFKAAVQDAGLIPLDWGVNLLNDQHSLYQAVVAEQLDRYGAGQWVILLHDRENLVGKVEMVVSECRRRGRIVRMGER